MNTDTMYAGLRACGAYLKTAGATARNDLILFGPPHKLSGAAAGGLGADRLREMNQEWRSLTMQEREQVMVEHSRAFTRRVAPPGGPPGIKRAAAPTTGRGGPPIVRPTSDRTPPSPSGRSYWTVKEVQDHVMAAPISADYWRGEVGELADEIRKGDLKGMRDEWGDVSLLGQLHLHGRGVPGIGSLPVTEVTGANSLRKFIARRDVWRRIFEHHGLQFHNRFLVGGGNYAKLKKVAAALVLAGLPADKVDARWLRGTGLVTEA